MLCPICKQTVEIIPNPAYIADCESCGFSGLISNLLDELVETEGLEINHKKFFDIPTKSKKIEIKISLIEQKLNKSQITNITNKLTKMLNEI